MDDHYLLQHTSPASGMELSFLYQCFWDALMLTQVITMQTNVSSHGRPLILPWLS